MDILEKYKKFDHVDINNLKLIPQIGIKHKLFPSDCNHNAIWDLYVTKNGRVYFALCAELEVSQYVRLYEYIYESNEFKLCFSLEDVIIQEPNQIITSKIHTSICEINDGRLIMTTHTTAQSPAHPFWMLDQYYTHPFEGYQGSVILLYDMETGAVENKGIPVPRESIYGACYDPSKNCLYFTGYIRGHMYRYDLDTNKVTDYGQTTEFGSFRVVMGPDGNIYSNSRSGNFFRINTKTQLIENLNIMFPKDYGEKSEKHTQLNFVGNGPDGKMYLGIIFSQNLYAFDPKTDKLECIGPYLPIGIQVPDTCAINGILFDSENIMWYTTVIYDAILQSCGSYLCRWDIFGGGSPESFGLMGTINRNVVLPSELHLHHDILYAADSNHGFDIPGMLAINLKEFYNYVKSCDITKSSDSIRPLSADIYNYAYAKDGEQVFPYAKEIYDKQRDTMIEYYKYLEAYNEFKAENSLDINCNESTFIRLWELVGHENSQVSFVKINDDNSIYAEFGNIKKYALQKTKTGNDENSMNLAVCKNETIDTKLNGANGCLVNDAIHDKMRINIRENFVVNSTLNTLTNERYEIVELMSQSQSQFDEISEVQFSSFDLPTLSGRKYKSVVTAYTAIGVDKFLVGTKDGMMAIIHENNCYSLGTCTPNSEILKLVYCDQTKTVYGIAGGNNELGTIFKYNEKEGLHAMGRNNVSGKYGLSCSSMPCCIDVSKDGRMLIVGCCDRMGMIYIYML